MGIQPKINLFWNKFQTKRVVDQLIVNAFENRREISIMLGTVQAKRFYGMSHRHLTTGGNGMKKVLVLSLASLALVIAAPQLMAMQVTPYQEGGHSFGNGGEFRAIPSPDLSYVLANYSLAKDTRTANGFYTFCIEVSETFNPGSTYNVALNSKAIWGSVGPGGDPLSVGTTWLYSQFAKGVLAGYDYLGATRSADAGELQLAIWALENESGGSISANYAALLTAQFGVGIATWQADAAVGAYGVMAMNLTDAAGGRHQDMLVLVPDGGLTVTLLGMALGGLALVSRKIRKS